MASESQKLRVANATNQTVTLLLPLEHGAKRLELQKSNHDRASGEVTLERVIRKLPLSLTLLPKGMEGSSVDDLPVTVGRSPDFVRLRNQKVITCTVYDADEEAKEREKAEAEAKERADKRTAASAAQAATETPAGDTPPATSGDAPAPTTNTTDGGTTPAGDTATKADNAPAEGKGNAPQKAATEPKQKGATGAKATE